MHFWLSWRPKAPVGRSFVDGILIVVIGAALLATSDPGEPQLHLHRSAETQVVQLDDEKRAQSYRVQLTAKEAVEGQDTTPYANVSFTATATHVLEEVPDESPWITLTITREAPFTASTDGSVMRQAVFLNDALVHFSFGETGFGDGCTPEQLESPDAPRCSATLIVNVERAVTGREASHSEISWTLEAFNTLPADSTSDAELPWEVEITSQ